MKFLPTDLSDAEVEDSFDSTRVSPTVRTYINEQNSLRTVKVKIHFPARVCPFVSQMSVIIPNLLPEADKSLQQLTKRRAPSKVPELAYLLIL